MVNCRVVGRSMTAVCEGGSVGNLYAPRAIIAAIREWLTSGLNEVLATDSGRPNLLASYLLDVGFKS